MFDVFCEQLFTDDEVTMILNQSNDFLSLEDTNKKFQLQRIKKCRYATVNDFKKLESIVINKLKPKGIVSLDEDEINFIHYEKGHFFKEHTDVLKKAEYRPFKTNKNNTYKNDISLYEPRIYTLIIQLSDVSDYDGGELIIEGNIYPKNKGTVIIFKSSMRHSVSEITRGDRKVFTNFLRKKNLKFESNLI